MRKAITNLIIILLIFANTGWCAETVKVGLIIFPPFIEQERGRDKYTGIAVELIGLMNSFQGRYRFVTVTTSAPRKQRDFENGLYDMMMFDDINWGWKGYPVEASQVILRGDGEVYVALAKEERGEDYFSDFRNKKMIGHIGYHYKFAGFNSDPGYLKKTFSMQLTYDHGSSVRMILRERGDIAVMTRAYLFRYMSEHPETESKLLISKKMDQEYNHTIIIRKGIRPSVGELDKILKGMEQKGILKHLWESHGIYEMGRQSGKK